MIARKKIQQLREARGWSRSELSRRASLNAVTVGWVEDGRFQPYEIQLQRLAEALGVDFNDRYDLLDDCETEEGRHTGSTQSAIALNQGRRQVKRLTASND